MNTRKKSDARKYLEKITGGPLTFAKMLRAIRLCDEASQVDFATKLGISKSHLCDIEKGRKSVSPERAEEFAQVLGYSEEQFVRLAIEEQLKKLRRAYVVKIKKTAA